MSHFVDLLTVEFGGLVPCKFRRQKEVTFAVNDEGKVISPRIEVKSLGELVMEVDVVFFMSEERALRVKFEQAVYKSVLDQVLVMIMAKNVANDLSLISEWILVKTSTFYFDLDSMSSVGPVLVLESSVLNTSLTARMEDFADWEDFVRIRHEL